MAWQLLAAALPAAAKVAGTALSKPKQEDYKPQTDYMKKYLSFLRGRTADREVAHLAMQPALKVAGKQGRQMQRQVGYDVARAGLGGSGIEAQMRLSAGQQTQDALATATDKAVAAQAAETARVGEKAAGITAQIQAEEARADQAFKAAESQWERQLTSDVIGGVASVASAGISQYGQNIAGFRQALTEGSVPAGTTYSQFKEMAKSGVIQGAQEFGVERAELGKMSPAEYAQYTGASKERISGLRVAENIYGGSEKIKEMRAKGFSDDYIISEAQRLQGMYVSQVGQGADPRLVNEALGLSGMGNYSAPAIVETKVEPKVEEKVVEPKVVTKVETLPTIKDDQKNKIKQIRTSARINEDGSESTVIMAQSDNFAYPTLFPKDPANPSSDPNDWMELDGDAAFKEAKKRGEVFEFGSESEAEAFAEGNWKDKQLTEPVEKTKTKKELLKEEAEAKRLAEKKAAAEKAVEAKRLADEKLREEALSLGLDENATRKDINRAKYRKKEQERIDREKREKSEADKQRLIKIRKEKEAKKIEEKQLKETMAIYEKQKEKEKVRAETKEVIAKGAKRAKYKNLIKKPMKIKRDGKDYKVVVDDVDLENDKITFTHTGGEFTNKKRTTSLEKFDEYRGDTNMASKKIEPIFETVKKFESGNRASRNNNMGAVVFSDNLQKQYPEMTRGDSFVDEAGKTRYTAKFPDKKTGDRINKEIMFKIFEEVGGDTAKFYSRWSGLPEDSATVKNFVSSIGI